MNKFFRISSLGLDAFAMIMTACSDDDEPGAGKPAEPTINNVFSEGLPASVDGATFTTNSKGQLTKIVNGNETVTFEYGTFTFSKATQYDALMKLRDSEYPQDGCDIYMQLNDCGFVTNAIQVYLDEEDGIDTWKFEYNADGQLTRLQRSESEDDFKITYANGDIVKVTQDDEDGDHREYTFKYTNNEYKTAVANKGNIMLFDCGFNIDMDEFEIAYYAGLLGRSTKNLPMGYDEKSTEGGSNYTYSQTYRWKFDAKNLPTEFYYGDSEWDIVKFSWR